MAVLASRPARCAWRLVSVTRPKLQSMHLSTLNGNKGCLHHGETQGS